MTAQQLMATHLAYAYAGRPAVQDVSLTIEPGEFVAVTGASGSGKSTLLLCLAGVLVPDHGEVHLGELLVSAAGEAERSRLRRTEVGVLFQYGQLVGELTALDNVALPLLLQKCGRAEADAQARRWLARLAVEDVADQRPGAMSGGQGQRVAVARALVTQPSVLFADEPTGSLDSVASEQVMSMVRDIARESAMTVVLVTHDAKVAAYGDREVVLRDGRLVGGSAGADPEPAYASAAGGVAE